MKITKEQLNQMIQEELDAYLSETDEDMDLTFEGEEEEKMGDTEDMPAEAEGEGDNEELMASLRNLYDVLQGMFGGEEAPAEDEMAEAKAKDEDEMDEAKKAEDKEDLNESVTINRFKQLANIRG
jgi:ElaB/YqjD/DUF883 family membrane-anchored ribosome-binding protein